MSPIKLPNDHSPIENPNINPIVIPIRNRSAKIFFISSSLHLFIVFVSFVSFVIV